MFSPYRLEICGEIAGLLESGINPCSAWKEEVKDFAKSEGQLYCYYSKKSAAKSTRILKCW